MAKRFRFSGKELDTESGLYFFGARYLAPWLGRWTAADPGLLIVAHLRLPVAAGRELVPFSPPGHFAFVDV